MKYMGSKDRIAKEILPIMLHFKKEEQTWVEPFVGGANMIDKVKGKRIGADNHQYLINFWDNVSKGWLPPREITEKEYKNIQNNKEFYDPALVGYVGFALSYGGKWFGGWRRDSIGKRNYVDEAFRNLIKQAPLLTGVTFVCSSFDSLDVPENSFIYCDPPYKGTTKYNLSFDHGLFWEWCRNKTKQGHTVFISEYEAPSDFECVWQKEITSSLTKNTGSKKGIEKLFRMKK
jgi:DNA adenine methylase